MVQEYLREQASGFLDFIREQGVMGLALGFILGTAVSKVVTAFSNDVIDPLVALVFGSVDRLEMLTVGPVRIGDFLSNVIDFLFIAATVYLLFRLLGIRKLDLKKL